MKPLIIPGTIACILAFTHASGQAPPDNSALCREQMKKLAALSGQWEGEASIQTGPGPAQVITQKEDVQFKIDSTLLVIEGTGTRSGGNEIVFNAYAVINFNPGSQSYAFRSFLKDGRSTDAYFKILEQNKFEWGFDIAANAGKVRYTITLNDPENTWNEVGEFSRDNTSWSKFMEMRLVKKD